MADNEPKRRGRRSNAEKAAMQAAESPVAQDGWADEVATGNPTAPTVESETLIPTEPLEPTTDTITESVAGAEASGSTSQESPIEENTHELVAEAAKPVSGWENDMRLAPIDGRRVMVSETGKDRGVLVYWRVSKRVDKKNLRYVEKGRWTELLTRADIEFTPNYWKPYNPEEYWPLTR